MSVELKIPVAPDFLFKKERTGYILNEDQQINLIEKMEAVEHFGVCIYYKNVPYAKKWFVSPEAIFAINQVKKILLEGAKLLKSPLFLLGLYLNKKKMCQSFNVVFDKLFGKYTFKDEFMCRAAFNFANFLHGILLDAGIEHDIAKEVAFNIAQIVEYDDAYRFRLQDMANELDVDNFLKSPQQEIERLIVIFTKRSTSGVPLKLKPVFKLIKILTFFTKKSLIRNVRFLKDMQPDEHDRYWMCIRADQYKYFGLSDEERHLLYTERPITYNARV